MMKRLFVKNTYLIAILAVAFLLRFYNLGSYPAFNADEAALGYNAYSLLQTGKDEHGHSWPIHFQSFNDWKPGLTVYLIMPMVQFFGLNEWSVRVLPAFLGVLGVLGIYLLVSELTNKNRNISLAAAFLLAVSPWHIHFSRGAWEVTIATTFITFGLVFLLRSFTQKKYLYLSVILFVLSLYTYHAARIVAPLLVFMTFITHIPQFRKNIKGLLVAIILGVVLTVPLAIDMTKPEALSRAAGVGLFADPGPRSRIEEQRGEHSDYQSLFPKLLHNKAVNYGLAFLDNWTAHFHGEFLFLSGDEIQRNRVPETGELYTIEILFLGTALFVLSRTNTYLRRKTPFLWLLIAPVAAALTFQAPHALRAQNMIIPLTIFSGFGLSYLWNYQFKRKQFLKITRVVLSLILALSISRYLLMYYSHMSQEYSYSSQYGVKELVTYVSENSSNYAHVLVTDRYDQPYVLFLFYLKYPPQLFQNEGRLTDKDGFGFSTVRSFGKYEFRSIKFDEDRPKATNTLIAGTKEEIPDEANIVKNIYGSNGFLYFRVVAN